MIHISDELKGSINNLLPYLVEPDSNVSIVSDYYRVFYKSGGLLDKVAYYLKDIGIEFKVHYNRGTILFNSGAKLTFNRLDSLDGLLLDAVLMVVNNDTKTQDICKVKSRMWNSKGCHKNIWFIDINNT